MLNWGRRWVEPVGIQVRMVEDLHDGNWTRSSHDYINGFQDSADIGSIGYIPRFSNFNRVWKKTQDCYRPGLTRIRILATGMTRVGLEGMSKGKHDPFWEKMLSDLAGL